MERAGKLITYAFCTVWGILVTIGLFSFLVIGTAVTKPQAPAPDLGAVRLSDFENRPVTSSQARTADTDAKVEEFADMDLPDISMDLPGQELRLAAADMEFAPSVAGTLPVSGLPSTAVSGGPKAMPSGGALTLGEVDEQPRAIFAPAPAYPEGIRHRDDARLVLRILLDRDGKVKTADVRKCGKKLMPFCSAARKAVLQWRFSPCKKEGKPVACIADQPFSFSIQKN